MDLFGWKICKTCGEDLPTTEYSFAHTKVGRYRGSCKRCERDKLRNTNAYDKCECGKTKKRESSHCVICRNRRNAYDPEFEKRCSKCRLVKTAAEFGWRMHRGVKRIRNACKECSKAITANSRAKLSREQRIERKRTSEKRAKARERTEADYRLRRRRAAIRTSCNTLGLKDRRDEIAAKELNNSLPIRSNHESLHLRH